MMQHPLTGKHVMCFNMCKQPKIQISLPCYPDWIESASFRCGTGHVYDFIKNTKYNVPLSHFWFCNARWVMVSFKYT